MNEQTVSKMKQIATVTGKKIVTVVGLTAAIFCSGLLIYEPYVQSQIVHVIPEPIVIPPNPEIAVIAAYQTKRNSRLPEEIAKLQAELIIDAAVNSKLPTSLIVGMSEVESTFDPLAQSSVGAKGLMQVYQSAKVDIDHAQAFNLSYNLQKGCEVLNEKLSIYDGNLQKALSAYSGNAKDYTEKVYTNIGRFEMFKYKQLDSVQR
jgi:hypothetical protein